MRHTLIVKKIKHNAISVLHHHDHNISTPQNTLESYQVCIILNYRCGRVKGEVHLDSMQKIMARFALIQTTQEKFRKKIQYRSKKNGKWDFEPGNRFLASGLTFFIFWMSQACIIVWSSRPMFVIVVALSMLFSQYKQIRVIVFSIFSSIQAIIATNPVYNIYTLLGQS